MKNHLLWLLLLPATASACPAAQQAHWEQAAQTATEQQQHSISLDYYLKIAQCEPNRGDIRIELLRTYLALQQLDQAIEQRQWLVEHRAPAGLIQLVDTWIARSNLEQQAYLTQQAQTRTTQLIRLSLGAGYSSNANEVTSDTSIPVEIDGIPLQLELTDRPEASDFQAFSADYQRRLAQSDLYLGAQLQHFRRLNEYEQRLFGGAIKRYTCLPQQQCELSMHLLHQQRDQNRQQQIQIGTALRSKSHLYGFYYRYLAGNTEPDIQTVGLDWRYFNPHYQLHGAVEREQADKFRPGGDRTRLMLSARFHPRSLPRVQWQFNHQREYDSQAYAPIFWGNTQRERQVTRARIDYTYQLNQNWILQSQLNWQDTRSNLGLFSNKGWTASLQLHWHPPLRPTPFPTRSDVSGQHPQ